ncbi:transposase [Methylocystis sp.]|uniref:transposase n=1 Tax=Methylocystis sp. TaxID=1911079 RepID=UPI002735FECB|nr:transposase [Methylocystis sp.]MDP3553807.1 transposase [Methylocystis sp.]
MPELGRRSPKAIAALAGLAPFNNDSGKRRGQRMIKGGRTRCAQSPLHGGAGRRQFEDAFGRFCPQTTRRRKTAKAGSHCARTKNPRYSQCHLPRKCVLRMLTNTQLPGQAFGLPGMTALRTRSTEIDITRSRPSGG